VASRRRRLLGRLDRRAGAKGRNYRCSACCAGVQRHHLCRRAARYYRGRYAHRPAGAQPDQGPAGRSASARQARRAPLKRVPYSLTARAIAGEPADERERFFAACRIARETADDRKAFAKQGFYILRKVVEVDRFLAGHPDWTARVFETHPEAVFWRLNGEQPVPLPKEVKSRVHAPGLALRRTLLMKAGLPREVLSQEPPRGAARDDLVDAFACLVTAQRIAACQVRSLPEKPPRDERGLAMAIWV
jgi:predicted RNase H-like nuclease